MTGGRTFRFPALLLLALAGCRAGDLPGGGGDPVGPESRNDSFLVTNVEDTLVCAVRGNGFTAHRTLTTAFSGDSLRVTFAINAVTNGECALYLRSQSTIFYARRVTTAGTFAQHIQGRPTSVTVAVTGFSGSAVISVIGR